MSSGAAKSTAQILREARALISDPERWTQRAFARPAQGKRETSPLSDDAKCWCAMGAIERAADGSPLMSADRAMCVLDDVVWELHPRAASRIAYLNDGGSRAMCHPRVLAAFDRAIELAEAE